MQGTLVSDFQVLIVCIIWANELIGNMEGRIDNFLFILNFYSWLLKVVYASSLNWLKTLLWLCSNTVFQENSVEEIFPCLFWLAPITWGWNLFLTARTMELVFPWPTKPFHQLLFLVSVSYIIHLPVLLGGDLKKISDCSKSEETLIIFLHGWSCK